MNYRNKLLLVTSYVEDNFVDTTDLVEWLGLSMDDIVEAFPDHMVKKYSEVYEATASTETEDDEAYARAREAWEDDEE